MIAFSITAALAAIAYAVWLRSRTLALPKGSGQMLEIAEAIRTGSRVYLRRQNMTVLWVAAALAAIMWIVFGFETAAGFLAGAGASALAGWLGVMTARAANVRTAQAAKHGLARAFAAAFSGGAV